jgi:putative drug exporter of the RND superfamily
VLKLTRWCIAHRRRVFVTWVAIAILTTVIASAVGRQYATNFTLPGTEAQRALDLLKSEFPAQSGDVDTIVFHTSTGTVDDPAVRDAIDHVVAQVANDPHVVSVISPFSPRGAYATSADRKTAFATVNYDKPANQVPNGAGKPVLSQTEGVHVPGLTVAAGGQVIENAEGFSVGPATEVGALAALIILLLTFGSLLAAGMPLVTAGLGLVTSVALIGLATHVTSMSNVAPQLALMIGLGVGIDYALFIVTRFRENYLIYGDVNQSVIEAMDTSGRAILLAGTTVMIALLGMFATGVSFMYGLSIASVLAVLLTLTASLTVLPAMLSRFGARIVRMPGERRRFGRRRAKAPAGAGAAAGVVSASGAGDGAAIAARGAGDGAAMAAGGAGDGAAMAAGGAGDGAAMAAGGAGDGAAMAAGGAGDGAAMAAGMSEALRDAAREDAVETKRSRWRQWSRLVQARPWPLAIISAGLMVLLLLPVFGLRLQSSDAGNDPHGTSTRRAFDLLAEGFGPGFNGPLLVIAELPSQSDAATVLPALHSTVATTPGVAAVTQPQLSPSGNVAVIRAYPTTAPQAAATTDLVNRLRHHVLPPLEHRTGVPVLVGGFTAGSIDFSHVLSAKLPLFIGIVVVLSAVLLFVLFRSLVIPVQAALMNLLSIGGALGVTVAVFEKGWFASVIGVEKGPVEPWIPVLMFAVVFGLSMDYEVFLVSRVREEWVRQRDASAAVADGIAYTGRVISAAAAIMVCVFLSFMLGNERVIREFGFGLAVAVLLDALVVRCVLLPAVLELLGRSTWWLPKWLDSRLPHYNIEGMRARAALAEARAGAGQAEEREPAQL